MITRELLFYLWEIGRYDCLVGGGVGYLICCAYLGLIKVLPRWAVDAGRRTQGATETTACLLMKNVGERGGFSNPSPSYLSYFWHSIAWSLSNTWSMYPLQGTRILSWTPDKKEQLRHMVIIILTLRSSVPHIRNVIPLSIGWNSSSVWAEWRQVLTCKYKVESLSQVAYRAPPFGRTTTVLYMHLVIYNRGLQRLSNVMLYCHSETLHRISVRVIQNLYRTKVFPKDDTLSFEAASRLVRGR